MMTKIVIGSKTATMNDLTLEVGTIRQQASEMNRPVPVSCGDPRQPSLIRRGLHVISQLKVLLPLVLQLLSVARLRPRGRAREAVRP